MKDMKYRNVKANIVKDKIFMTVIILLSFVLVIPLLSILFYIIGNGIKFVNLELLTSLPKPPGETGGGVVNAITGSLIIVLIASVIAIPIGIFSGIYLSEKKNKIAEFVRVSADMLQGIPSIVIGIVAYIWIVIPMKSFSALSGSIALAIMMLPVIIKNTEETMKMIPDSLKEAAYALGVPYFRVVLRVLLPAGLSGIITGVLVGVARVLGETAPLLFTAFGNPFLSADVTKPMEAVPHIIFKYATSPYTEWQNTAWGASFLLVSFVLLLNIISKVVVKKWKVKF
jgi:phosphate transport system permease protein